MILCLLLNIWLWLISFIQVYHKSLFVFEILIITCTLCELHLLALHYSYGLLLCSILWNYWCLYTFYFFISNRRWRLQNRFSRTFKNLIQLVLQVYIRLHSHVSRVVLHIHKWLLLGALVSSILSFA